MHERAPTRVLLSRQQLAARVAELGARITTDYAGRSLVVVPVAGGIPLSDGEARVPPSLNATLIGAATAREIGWGR